MLHKACNDAIQNNHFPGGSALGWAERYQCTVASEQSCINEWLAMSDLESVRPDSFCSDKSVPDPQGPRKGWDLHTVYPTPQWSPTCPLPSGGQATPPPQHPMGFLDEAGLQLRLASATC